MEATSPASTAPEPAAKGRDPECRIPARKASLATEHAPDVRIPLRFIVLGLVSFVTAPLWLAFRPVVVTMTLTTPGCPMNDCIPAGVEQALLAVEGVEEVEVRIVWEPAWTTDRMFREVRRSIGLAETG